MRKAFLERALVELVYKFNEKSTAMFEKVHVIRSLKCHSNFLGGHTHTYIYILNGHQPRSHNSCSRMHVQGNNYGKPHPQLVMTAPQFQITIAVQEHVEILLDTDREKKAWSSSVMWNVTTHGVMCSMKLVDYQICVSTFFSTLTHPFN